MIRGPASTLYRSNALAGVINVRTQRPDLAPRLFAQLWTSLDAEVSFDASAAFRSARSGGFISASGTWMHRFVDANGDDFSDVPMMRSISVSGRYERGDLVPTTGLAARAFVEERWGGQRGKPFSLRGSDPIYKLQSTGVVSTSELASALDVAAASVTSMIKRLAGNGLVHNAPRRGVELTGPGRKVALEIVRHHRLLETYLREVMGFSWKDLHDEAENLEHHISEEFGNRLDEMFGHPTHDPHGHPIPTRDGVIADASAMTLGECAAGDVCVVDHLNDEDPELLHYLEDLKLLPGAKLQIIAVEPFEGPISLRVDGAEISIGYNVALNIFVRDANASDKPPQ